MGLVVLIGGGARSGKSRFALDYALRFERRAFLATAQPLDREMDERIRLHQTQRGPEWTTLEEPLDLAGTIARQAAKFDVIVVDCLTLWLSNVMADPERIARREIENLVQGLDANRQTGSRGSADQGPSRRALVLVTNEVGSGIVPDHELGRRYRDLAGEMNQRVAAVANQVYWMVFGVPLVVRGEGEALSGISGKAGT